MKTQQRSFARHITQFGCYVIPFYPLFKAFLSIKQVVGIGTGIGIRMGIGGGAEARIRGDQTQTIDKTMSKGEGEGVKESATKQASLKLKRVLTFQQAFNQRPDGAISINAIERLCLAKKRTALAVGFLCLCLFCGSVLGQNYIGALLALLSVCFCAMFVIKHDHRLWQIERGRKNPDQTLGDFRTFFAAPGMFFRLLSPRQSQNPECYDSN